MKKAISHIFKIAKSMSGKPVVIRTADIGGDKLPDSFGINSESLERALGN